ncbi:MAG: T9SS type A sorting domain-containing protein [Bacteroidetes bacterium]|nr:T9SS type A sorting domain-containing protein [Bacteroidota bacterium]
MKRIITLLICIGFIGGVRAQCIVDAGPDRILCAQMSGGVIDTVQLNATVSGAAGPVTCEWFFRYADTAGSTIIDYTAAELLDSTASLHPRIVAPIWGLTSYHPLWVVVTDSAGHTCRDTLSVKLSQFVYCLAACQMWNVPATSVTLFGCIGGGVAPLSYAWTPSRYLSDTTSPGPVATTPLDSFMTYYCHVTDSAGCFGGTSVCNIQLTGPASINETNLLHAKIYPDPIDRTSILEIDNAGNQSYAVTIYNDLGAVVVTTSLQGHTMDIGALGLSGGVYGLMISDDQRRSRHMRFSAF